MTFDHEKANLINIIKSLEEEINMYSEVLS